MKDQHQLEALQAYFAQVLELPQDAIDWLLMLFHSIQVLDDFADGEEVSRADLDLMIWNVLVGMAANPFYQTNNRDLIPLLANQLLKWQAADDAEREGKYCAMTYAWRAGYYDIVLCVVNLIHGPNKAQQLAGKVMSLYGEKYQDYLQEMQHA